MINSAALLCQLRKNVHYTRKVNCILALGLLSLTLSLVSCGNGTSFFSSNILEQEVDNSESSCGKDDKTNTYYCENTTDKLYLPNCQEIYALSSGQKATTTDWARCRSCRCARGLENYDDQMYGEFDPTSIYWLRSPDACGESYALVIGEEGFTLHYGTVSMAQGVRPGMKITIS